VSIDAGAGNPREMYALRDALMENGIVLVDLRRSQGDPHVVYEQPADAETDADSAHLQQVVTIALVFATHAGTVDRLATATAIDPRPERWPAGCTSTGASSTSTGVTPSPNRRTPARSRRRTVGARSTHDLRR